MLAIVLASEEVLRLISGHAPQSGRSLEGKNVFMMC